MSLITHSTRHSVPYRTRCWDVFRPMPKTHDKDHNAFYYVNMFCGKNYAKIFPSRCGNLWTYLQLYKSAIRIISIHTNILVSDIL